MTTERIGSTQVSLRSVSDSADLEGLTPEEAQLVERTAPAHRKRELISGRLAVAEAFTAFHVSPRPSVLSDAEGRPVLDPPSPWRVSIAHDGGLVVAVVSSEAVGIDIFDLGRLPQLERVVEHRIRTHDAIDLVGAPLGFPPAALLWTAWEALGKKSGAGVLGGAMRVPIGPVRVDGGRFIAQTTAGTVRWWEASQCLVCLATG